MSHQLCVGCVIKCSCWASRIALATCKYLLCQCKQHVPATLCSVASNMPDKCRTIAIRVPTKLLAWAEVGRLLLLLLSLLLLLQSLSLLLLLLLFRIRFLFLLLVLLLQYVLVTRTANNAARLRLNSCCQLGKCLKFRGRSSRRCERFQVVANATAITT